VVFTTGRNLVGSSPKIQKNQSVSHF